MKKLALVFIVLAVFMTGCAGIQFKSPAQQQIVELTVSVAAKALGLKLAQSGFMWTKEIELFYRAMVVEDKLSLDAAQLAQKYVQDNVDPLLAPDLIKLASLVGFEFDAKGMIISTTKVDPAMLRIAADGFRLAVLTKQK